MSLAEACGWQVAGHVLKPQYSTASVPSVGVHLSLGFSALFTGLCLGVWGQGGRVSGHELGSAAGLSLRSVIQLSKKQK